MKLRPLFPDYATPLSPKMYNIYQQLRKKKIEFYDLLLDVQDRKMRNVAINFKNLTSYNPDKKTIEVRCPNGTLNPIIWQNNISFFAHFLNACNRELDFERLEERLNPVTTQDIVETYQIMDLNLALELADVIFDSSIDKLYFLRQYTKTEPSFTKEDKPKSLSKQKQYRNII